jgi:hypothetical protein
MASGAGPGAPAGPMSEGEPCPAMYDKDGKVRSALRETTHVLIIGGDSEARFLCPPRRRNAPRAYVSAAIRSVTVKGLAIVETSTQAVTNEGTTSYSSASTVVSTALGMPDWRIAA